MPSGKPLPNLTQIFDRLFAKRPDRPLVFGEALFKPPPAPSAEAGTAPAAAGDAPSAARKAAPMEWIGRLLRSLRTIQTRRPTSIVGMDLGASALKIVRVDRSSGEPRVVGLACEEYPMRLEGKAQEEFLQERLLELKRRGLLDGPLVVGFANNRLVMELITLPKMPAADLGRAITWEAKERLSADPATYSIRHVVLGETATDGQQQYEILVAAAPRDEVISQWQAFSSQGYRILAVEPDILASFAACEAAGLWRPEEFVGLLEVGRRSSTLAFIVRGGVRFIRSFPIAGDSITQSIVDYCQTDYEKAEAYKREIGLSQMALEEDRRVVGMEVDPRVRVSHALGLYLERLAAEVDHSLRYFTYELGQVKGRHFDCLYLLGGGALLKNLAAFLASRVNTRVEVADPFERCVMSAEARQELQARTHGTRLAAALGLALRPVTR